GVRGTAGGKRHDDGDRLCRIGLRRGAQRGGGVQHCGDEQPSHGPHSTLIPAALMTGHHLSISALWKAASASGVSCSGGKMSCARSTSFRRMPGSASAFTTASFSLATISGGVALGAHNACQNEK